MGTGKSSVGRVLAQRLGIPFIDLDAEIAALAGCSINEIFARDGEAGFRVLEGRCLAEVLQRGMAVVATGGGAVISDANRALLSTSGLVVNLTASLDRILERLSGAADRPLYPGEGAAERVKTLMAQRERFYAAAHIRIDTDGKSVEDVAAEIMSSLARVPA
jgi:shikimate kinase